MSDREQENNEKGTVLRITLRGAKSFIVGLHATVMQTETRRNISLLEKCNKVYAGPYMFYFKETLRKQKMIACLGPLLFVISIISIAFFLMPESSSGSNFAASLSNIDVSTCGYNCLRDLGQEIMSSNLFSETSLTLSGVLVFGFFQIMTLEKVNTLTKKRRLMEKVLVEIGIITSSNSADVLYAEGIGVFVDSRRISESSISGSEELWKTLNLDPGEPVRSQRYKSAFFVPTKFILPESIVYNEYDFDNLENL